MRKLLLVLPFLLGACESLPRFLVAGPDQTVEVDGRQWTVTRVSNAPVYYRAVRTPTESLFFGPPGSSKESQAVKAIQKVTGCRVVRSTLYPEVSEYYFAQVDCGGKEPETPGKKRRIYTSPIL